jgi:serine/threonine protein kinase
VPLTSGIDTAAVQAGLPSYVVYGELDAGGYGVTFDAEYGGQRLAVKVLDTQAHEAAIRTPLEINALRSINHPNVVRMVDEGFLDTPTDPNRYRYIACEFVEGSNLLALAQGGHAFTTDEVLSIGRDLAVGLQAVRGAKLVHRDVKHKNVMYDTATGKVVLLDVGIAKHLEVTPGHRWRRARHLRVEVARAPEGSGCRPARRSLLARSAPLLARHWQTPIRGQTRCSRWGP